MIMSMTTPSAPRRDLGNKSFSFSKFFIIFAARMEQKRILIVDDEQDLCEILLYNLTAAGYQAEVAYSAEMAIEKEVAQYDLLLLDVMMPGMSGFELARQLKGDEATASVPIIFLTAKDTEEDMLHGFGLGADDYVKKPFSVREVMARVKAVLCRRESVEADKPKTLQYEGLVIDLSHKSVKVDGEAVALTKTEFELLVLLLTHRGKVFSDGRNEDVDERDGGIRRLCHHLYPV